MAEGNWAKDVIAVRSESIEVTVDANSFKDLGTINSLISFPTGYSIEGITLMTESNGNCIPFLRYYGGGISVFIRNFYSSQITTGLYIRAIFVKQ